MPPAIPRPVVRDPGAKKRHILEAARRLLVEHDFQDIVLDDVAKKAGVAKGTLFLHFKNKEELFSAAYADLSDSLGQELEALARTGLKGKELLAAAAKVVLHHFDRNRDFIGLGSVRMPACGARSRGMLTEKFLANQELLLSLLVLASSDAGKGLRDREFAAGAFIGLCRSVAVGRILRGHEGPFERESERVVSFFLDGSGICL
ncbi:MAG TPA: TetR/AcrR family transcriptional regulator [Elusimicrobiota bacterium]|nr:TetR/AcrR family transcriptional regulator [Elusimicrobiota bacterium]